MAKAVEFKRDLKPFIGHGIEAAKRNDGVWFFRREQPNNYGYGFVWGKWRLDRYGKHNDLDTVESVTGSFDVRLPNTEFNAVTD